MASTSSSSVQKSFKYDVFLSFRGEDTLKGFVDHLYHALNKRGIITYKDDEKIQKGERINEQLIKAIEDSRFYIVVFSKNYASSSWCLDELVQIMECQKMAEHTAYPVFYGVEPTDVRHQSGAFGKAFAKLVAKGKMKTKRIEEDEDQENEKDVGRWKNALKDAADLAGWELKNTVDGHEAKFIEKIIEDISPKLPFISLNIDNDLVGMKTRVLNVVSSLKLDSNDVHMIGIWGIGGGGKTTLARAIFNHISISFESQSFVDNVREGSKGSALKELQKQVLQDVLNDQKLRVKTVYDGSMMKKMMCGIKVLVVLDDVDHIDQLKALAGSPDWFKAGSRIIITTREKQVLVAHGIHRDDIYDVNLLSKEEAICLFSRCAFKRESPIQEYEELSRNVVHYAAGLPLTITVLGSFLYGRSIREWEDAIQRLKTIPEDQTLKCLELSYNVLEDDHKEIFLDIACILRGKPKDYAVRILESCGYNVEIGLSVLQQKSLITISDIHGLRMHDLIAEMGQHIVHCSYLTERSRLWIKDEIEDILNNELVSKVKSVSLEDSDLHPDIVMKGLRTMKELRFLLVSNEHIKWDINEVDGYLLNALQWPDWLCYGFRYLLDTLRGEKEVLNKLRVLDLSYSKLRTLDLGMAPNLETLCLGGCKDFVKLILPDRCLGLKYINLSDSKLRNLKLASNPNLEILDLHSCRHFVKLYIPVECPNLKFINASNSKLSAINLLTTPHLVSLNLGGCEDLEKLEIPVECLNLKFLDLSGSKLTDLNLKHTPHLERLILKGCNNFKELNMDVECSKLRFLNLSGSKLSNLNLGSTPNLEQLILAKCNDFIELHMSVVPPKLMLLELSGCKLSVQNLENLNHIIESYFTPRHERIFTHKIVKGNSKELHFIRFVSNNLVGMGTRVTNVVSSLEINPDDVLMIGNSDDVRMIGITGMGGSGKTTLATAVFDHISRWFEGVSFVKNIREISRISLNGLKELQKQVLSDVLKDQKVVVTSVSEGKNKIERMLASRKVLIVLDDVDDRDQLEALAGELSWFKPGSRIIITSRNEQVLVAHGVNFIHDVNLLTHEEATCLFSRYAFKTEIPAQGYEELSKKVVCYADGLPLTLKVLGSYLSGRNEPEWVEAIERLKTIPLKKTLTKLEISYDGLENDQKEIFLDVACLLKGMKRKKAIRVLESRGFHAEIGLRVLEQKSLLIVSDDERLQMHDHLEEMGMNIVRRSHPQEPSKHNRLWIREEIDDIFVNNLGTNEMISIKLHNSELLVYSIMKGLRKIKELRVLCVDNDDLEDVSDPVDQYLPNTLQSLYWVGYPFTCLPNTFQANMLVHLEMSRSKITQLWEGGEKKVLFKLKFLVLKYSDIRSFDMKMTPNLQLFRLKNCWKFVELHMPVVCPKLRFFYLLNSKVRSLKFGSAPCLETLILANCNDLVELHMPIESPKLKYLNLSGFKLSNINLGLAPHFKRLESLGELTLSIEDIRLPGSICLLKNLKCLILESCFLLEQLPEDLDRLQCLEMLHLSSCMSLRDIPDNICSINRLKYLHLPYCNLVTRLPEEIERLKSLKELDIVGTSIEYLPQSIFQLKDLRVVWSRERLERHGFTSLEEHINYTTSSYVYSCKGSRS